MCVKSTVYFDNKSSLRTVIDMLSTYYDQECFYHMVQQAPGETQPTKGRSLDGSHPKNRQFHFLNKQFQN